MRPATRAAAALTASVLLLSACGGGPSGDAAPVPTDGVLKLGVLNDIGQPPDPDVYYSGNGLALTTNLYEGLVRYEPGNHDEAKVVPLLAESWQSNDAFTEWTFKLRPGVVFHDGTPFDSSAVEASFQRRLHVAGGPAYMVEDVASVEEIDAYTVKIVLKNPNSAFIDFLASPYGPRMLSPKVLNEQAGNDFAQTYLATHDAGTGPYTLTKAVVGEGYQMQAFKDYWGDIDPVFTTIDLPVYTEISAMQLELEKGDLHALLATVPSASQKEYTESNALKAYPMPSFQLGVLYMNPNRQVMATPEARKALFEGIDWKTLIKQVVNYSAEPAGGNYPKGALPPEIDHRPLVYNPNGLKAWASSLPAGTPIRIGVSAGSTDSEQIANLIAAQLQTLGLQATVTTHQTSEVFGEFAKNPQQAPDVMVASGTWPDSNSPYMHGQVFWDKNGGLNFLQCYNDEITSLLGEALKTGSTETYAAAGAAAYRFGCSPIWAWMKDFMVAQPWLQGVEGAHSIAAPNTLDFNRLTIAR
ncbi:ABC transporter substrate-binding protein [Saccharopolyspora sp. K220]|uniref:ABC transporter substrate-binding protein n=1 Tax=Saccharopolyspora soli TaxID=2926618 RepID=UPI001F588210|nr:ABC transporter substrate-binding protein [Saccharopolyspora soli]MCI2424224.1 ABC transporter substrate-binding protein [Saccharopolyspora soli]